MMDHIHFLIFFLDKVPIRAMGDNKRNYMLTDLSDWLTYHGITNFKSSSHFPMRTTIPLRTVLTQPDYKLVDMLSKTHLFFSYLLSLFRKTVS